MSRYVGDFIEGLKEYQDVFDIYYCDNESKANRFFYTKDFPEALPYVAILDPSKEVKMKRKDKEIEDGPTSWSKYREIIFFSKI